MHAIRNYVMAESLEQAWELNQKGRNNIIIGGNLWLKMGSRNIINAIDLSSLGLDKIEEDEEGFRIGCMSTLHDIETNEGLNKAFQNLFKDAVRHIVGVQFRNCATVGGSIFPKLGFSDVFVRFRQLLLFFVGLLLFSPYIIFCLFDYGVSMFTGILISAMVLKYGWTGLVGGICFLFPQYFFYGMIFVIVYIYLFRNAAIGNFYTVILRGRRMGTHTLLKDRIMIILLIIGLFFVGCYIEAYISPFILRKIFGIFT